MLFLSLPWQHLSGEKNRCVKKTLFILLKQRRTSKEIKRFLRCLTLYKLLMIANVYATWQIGFGSARIASVKMVNALVALRWLSTFVLRNACCSHLQNLFQTFIYIYFAIAIPIVRIGQCRVVTRARLAKHLQAILRCKARVRLKPQGNGTGNNRRRH